MPLRTEWSTKRMAFRDPDRACRTQEPHIGIPSTCIHISLNQTAQYAQCHLAGARFRIRRFLGICMAVGYSAHRDDQVSIEGLGTSQDLWTALRTRNHRRDVRAAWEPAQY